MEEKGDTEDFKEHWTLCTQCAACYYRGPIVPHNWLELPPPEWSSPLHKCPSFEHFRFRAYTAVGRGNLATLIFDNNQFPITDDLVKIVYTCTSCGLCSEICKRWQPLRAIWALREELVKRGTKLPAPLGKIETAIKKFENIFGAKKVTKIPKRIPVRGENIYFAGCNVRFREPKIIIIILEVLRVAGLDIAYLGEGEKCCGFILAHDGNTLLFEEKAVQNIESLKKAGASQVIVTCAHCYKIFKKNYPLIVGELPFEVMHISELLTKLIDEKRITFSSEIRKKLTYHDPCFLGRHCQVYDEPRKVLRNIPGVEFNEMERNRKWSYCCGSGAKISSTCFPEFGWAIAKERLLEGKRAADTIVTACSTCYSYMKKSAKKEGMDVKIYDLPILVGEAMRIKV